MATRRVFVVWTHPLFREALQRLLAGPQVEWLGATSDAQAGQRQIRELQPDTILVEHAPGADQAFEISTLLEAAAAGVRIIHLSLSENELNVYHREQRSVDRAADLLQLITASASGGE